MHLKVNISPHMLKDIYHCNARHAECRVAVLVKLFKFICGDI